MLGTLAGALRAESASEEAAGVVIVANALMDDSLALARHYAARRGIPEQNIVVLPMPREETIGWRTFIDTIYQPLQDELLAREWLVGASSDRRDEIGRKRPLVVGHRIQYLVTCYGVPLRVSHDAELYKEVRGLTDRREFRTNRGAVDAELALIARPGYTINAFVPNPLYRKERPSAIERNAVVRVSRLDGPDVESVKGMIDRALEAEARGLIGRAYVDIGGPHAEGDAWMEEVAKQLAALDFDLTVDREPTMFAADARFDAPVLYFGWYGGQISGPMARVDFRFPPGAVALHLHSFSAETVRTTQTHWCGPLIARGVTATFGSVYEPYLAFTHQPHLLVEQLAQGKTLGEATFYALRALSWQQVVLGDPLYRPFKVSYAEQWKRRAELPDTFFPYVILREVVRLEKTGQMPEALRVLREAIAARPSEELRAALAERELSHATRE